jgi:type IV pilus assembly protein PilA
MKKMLKNQKGFSLVELLIVIAIMGILAALAFGMFAGVFTSSQRRSDEKTAGQIAKAISAYMVETSDMTLGKIGVTSGGKSSDLIVALQKKVEIDGKSYGPYLVPPEGTKASYDNYKPQWDGHKGYEITVYSALGKADVKPTEKEEDAKVTVKNDDVEKIEKAKAGE